MRNFRLLSWLLLTTIVLCAPRVYAQVVGTGTERFLPYFTTTGGTIPCATNDGTPITHQVISDPAMNVVPANSVEGPTAVVKGTSFTVKATLWIPPPFHGTVTYESVTYSTSSDSETISGSMIPVSIDTDIAIPYEFTIQVSAPSSVYSGSLQINLHTSETTPNGTQEGHAGTSFGLYTVYAQPTAPQVMPWVGVLQDACIFARHQSSEANVAKECTIGLYFGGNFGMDSPRRFYYPGNAGTNWILPNGNFDLAGFLSYGNSWWTTWLPGNCADVSTYLCICANALGLNFSPKAYTDSNLNGYLTNPICSIGSSPTFIGNYDAWSWGFHQIAQNTSDLVYEACAAQWNGPNGVYQNPPAGWLFVAPSSDPLLFNYWSCLPWELIPGLGLVNNPFPSIPIIHHNATLGVQ